jgi:hypothetical protein
MAILSDTTITFGKYKGSNLSVILKDRSYCKWLIRQEWFRANYEYLFNRVKEYDPKPYFLKIPPEEGGFINTYQYFNLNPAHEIQLPLTDDEISCYIYYTQLVNGLKVKISLRIEKGDENPYNIKAPIKWLQLFEEITKLTRVQFKEFITAYELPNITYVVEDIKKEGGIEYNGAKAYLIAKERSLKQEKEWEGLLKEKYGEDLAVQFKYEKCLFDFLNISNKTIFECKLGLKDFNEEQYVKYTTALREYRVIYLVHSDCAIDCVDRLLYTTNSESYEKQKAQIEKKTKRTKFEAHILHFNIRSVESILSILPDAVSGVISRAQTLELVCLEGDCCP